MEDILNDLSEKTASLQTSMKARILSNLLPSVAVRSRTYKFQGDFSLQVLLFPCCVTEHLDHRCYDNLSRSDVTLASSKMESAARTMLEAASRLEWWLVAAQSTDLASSPKEAKCHQLLITGARTVKMTSKTTLVEYCA